MRYAPLLTAVVVLVTFPSIPAQSQRLPDTVEIVGLMLPGSQEIDGQDQVVVAVRYEIPNYHLRPGDYFVFLMAYDKPPCGEGSQVLVRERTSTAEVTSGSGVVRLTVTVDALAASRAATAPATIWAYLIEGPLPDDDPQVLGSRMAGSTPVSFYLSS